MGVAALVPLLELGRLLYCDFPGGEYGGVVLRTIPRPVLFLITPACPSPPFRTLSEEKMLGMEGEWPPSPPPPLRLMAEKLGVSSLLAADL